MYFTKNQWIGGGIILAVVVIIACKVLWLSSSGFSENYLPMMYRGASTEATGSVGYAQDATYVSGNSMMDGVVDEFQMKSIAPPEYYDSAGVTAAEVDQKIIKTGYLDITVVDVGEVATKITTTATGKGGFIQDSSISEREDETKYGNITIRVPSEYFEETLTQIKTFADSVNTESSQGQDVTEQYTDIAAHLRNAKAQEEEYLVILKQAVSVGDVLAVQEHLGQVRAEIESLQGRLQYLENLTSYSTISVSLSETPTLRIPNKEFRPVNAVVDALQALVVLLQTLVIYVIWFVIVGGGILLPLALLVYVLYRLVRRFVARNQQPRH